MFVRMLLASLGLLASLPLSAKKDCGAEVKMLLDLSQQDKAITSLTFREAGSGDVYFYDTPKLKLFKKGLILRVRHGEADKDLTVKIRPNNSESFKDPSNGKEDFKCETDVNNGVARPSFSLKTKHKADPPADGEQLEKALSSAQREFVEQSGAKFNWKKVVRIGPIRSMAWEAKKADPDLDLELWSWSGQPQILEISTKTSSDEATATESRLKTLLAEKDIKLRPESIQKTRFALEALSRTASK